jgi:hypothetical protein
MIFSILYISNQKSLIKNQQSNYCLFLNLMTLRVGTLFPRKPIAFCFQEKRATYLRINGSFWFYELLDIIKGVALFDVAGLKSFLKPVHALFGGAVCKGIGHDLALHFLLNGVVTHGMGST